MIDCRVYVRPEGNHLVGLCAELREIITASRLDENRRESVTALRRPERSRKGLYAKRLGAAISAQTPLERRFNTMGDSDRTAIPGAKIVRSHHHNSQSHHLFAPNLQRAFSRHYQSGYGIPATRLMATASAVKSTTATMRNRKSSNCGKIPSATISVVAPAGGCSTLSAMTVPAVKASATAAAMTRAMPRGGLAVRRADR